MMIQGVVTVRDYGDGDVEASWGVSNLKVPCSLLQGVFVILQGWTMKVGLKKGTIVHGRFITTSFFRSSTEKPFSMKKLFRLSETAAGIEERYEVEIETMGMDKNHIHLLCGAHPKLSPDVSSRSLKASLPGRYLHESLQSKSTFGVESSGQMVTMWQLSEKEPIGKLLRDISRSKDYQNKTSNSYRSLVFNTL